MAIGLTTEKYMSKKAKLKNPHPTGAEAIQEGKVETVDTAQMQDDRNRHSENPTRATPPSAITECHAVVTPVATRATVSEEARASEVANATSRQPLTLADLENRLSVKRRTLSPDEKAALLGQINTLLREPPNSREAAEALLSIRDSATFVLLGGEWSGFFQGVLGWPADEGLRILKLYAEGRWAEVEWHGSNQGASETGSSDGAAQATPTSPDSKTVGAGECSSEQASLADKSGDQKTVNASSHGLTATEDRSQPPKEMEAAGAPSPSDGEAGATGPDSPVELRLADLDRKNAIQCRAKLSRSQVKQYKERMQANDKFPPIEVFCIGGLFCITDGLHRVEAALELGLDTILCIVQDGTRADAVKAALRANFSHGLPRTNADKRNAVKLALESFAGISDHQIATLCLVSQPFVGRVRKQLITVISSEPRRGRDGKMRRPITERTDQSSEASSNGQAPADHAGMGDEAPPTGSVPETPPCSSGNDDDASPGSHSNIRVVRQDVVQAVVAKIEKLILTEIEGFVEAEIIALFEAVKRVVTL